MAIGGLSSVLTARTHVAEALARTTALHEGYLRLRNDFQQLRIRPVRDGYGAEQPALLVRPDDAVNFTRGGWRNPLSQPRSSLERVAYLLDDKRPGAPELARAGPGPGLGAGGAAVSSRSKR